MGRLDSITNYVRMAASKDQKKCLFILLLCFVYEVFLSDLVQAVESDGESRIVERVTRRHNADVFFFYNSMQSMTCAHGNENTYLISEEICVSDQELFRGKC